MFRPKKTMRSGRAWSIEEVGISEFLVSKKGRKCREYVKSLALLMLAIYVNTLEDIWLDLASQFASFPVHLSCQLVDSLFF